MNPEPAITSAALIANPARTAVLMLVDGRAHPAAELAYCAGVSAQTASSHLAKLLAGGLLSVEREGRHRYYRLASRQVVSLLEHLASLGPSEPMRRRAPNRAATRLRFARCCYDHLAGSLGVGITKAMLRHGYLAQGDGKAFIVPPGGVEWFGRLGLDVARITRGRHGIGASASTGPSVNTILPAPSERSSWRELATLDGFSARPLRAQLMSHRKIGKRSRRIWALKGRTSG